MRVSFNVNLGSVDAGRCGIDFKQATLGSVLDCDESAGKWLVSSGIATEVVVPKPVEQVVLHAVPEVADLKAVPPVEVVAEPVVETPPVKPQHSNKRRN